MLGPLFKSSDPVELTEKETEYMVRCVKHTFARHIVLQVNSSSCVFNFCTVNTLKEYDEIKEI